MPDDEGLLIDMDDSVIPLSILVIVVSLMSVSKWGLKFCGGPPDARPMLSDVACRVGRAMGCAGMRPWGNGDMVAARMAVGGTGRKLVLLGRVRVGIEMLLEEVSNDSGKLFPLSASAESWKSLV